MWIIDKHRWTFIPLLLILAIGGYFRFTGLNWDGSTHLHPDERFLTDVASLLRSTDPLTYLKTSESTLNPYNVGRTFYVYGNFPMTMTRLSAEIADKACQYFTLECQFSFTFFDGIQMVGRFLSAAADLVTIVLLFLIGRLLFGWKVGLIAAFLLATAVLPIQQSHFFTMDNWAAMFAAMTMYAAVKTSIDGQSKIMWAVFGISLGLAFASRINLAPLAGIAPISGFLWLSRRGQSAGYNSTGEMLKAIEPLASFGRYWRSIFNKSVSGIEKQQAQEQIARDIQTIFARILLAALLSMITFRIAQPYAFADAQMVRDIALSETGQEPGFLRSVLEPLFTLNPQWQANLAEIRSIQSPDALFPPALQWTNRAPILFPLSNMIFWGMGLGAGILAWLAFIWAVWRVVRAKSDWRLLLLPVAWSGVYFLFMGTRWVKSMRYFLPIYPFLFLLAGWAVVEVGRRVGRDRIRRAAVFLVAVVIFATSVLWASSFVSIYQGPVTRVAATEWMFKNIPSGATLHFTTAGIEDKLQLALKRYEFTPGGPPLRLNFSQDKAYTLEGLSFNYLSKNGGSSELPPGNIMRVTLIDSIENEELAQTSVVLNIVRPRQSARINLPEILLDPNKLYTLQIELLSGSPLGASTSVLANEHWDDSLPLRYQGKDPYLSYYDGLPEGQIPITVPDSEQKREDFYRWLDSADYFVLSSQRALWSIPRVPLSYPLTMIFYEALFGGELGFELAATFSTGLSVGTIDVSDLRGSFSFEEHENRGWPPPGNLAAEEAFSVYDHPPVWIFSKQIGYSSGRVREVLGDVDLSQVVIMTPREATRAPNGLMLDSETFAVNQRNGTFHETFDISGLLSKNPWLAAIFWWIAIIIMGWIFLPLTFVVFNGLADKAYPLSRILALLLLSFLVWLPGSFRLLPNTRLVVLLALLLLATLNLIIFVVRKHQITSFVRNNLTLFLLVEIVGVGLYVLMLLIRLGNPDVWDVIWGGEKPMDMSYFTATMKSTYFPPYDPWFAGGYINYYYYGFVFVGTFTKLLGVVPAVAYNLIIPMLFSFAGLAAFSISFNIVAIRQLRRLTSNKASVLREKGKRISGRAVAAGIISIGFLILLGNLGELGVLLSTWYRAGEIGFNTGISAANTVLTTIDGAVDLLIRGEAAPIYPGDWFWIPTRAIDVLPGEVQPITEFPFFTFLYGDLHAHMIALPLTLLAIAWSVSLVISSIKPPVERTKSRWPLFARLLVGAIAIGALRATNTWDFPTYLFLGVLAVGYYRLRRVKSLSVPLIGQILFEIIALIGLSVLLFLPFTENYGVGYTSFSLWPGSYTSVQNYLVIHGLFLVITSAYLFVVFRKWAGSWSRHALEAWEPFAIPVFLLLFGYIALLVVLLKLGYLIAPLILSLTLLSGILAIRPGLPAEERVPLVMISSGLGLTLMVEFIVLDGDIGRMNTVFKFYLQAWTMLSLASGIAFVWLWPTMRKRTVVGRSLLVVVILLIFLAALYPLVATKAKWDIRMSDQAPLTLNGMTFMEVTEYQDLGYDGQLRTVELTFDHDAILWMQQNIEGSPVIAEAHNLNPYRAAANRIAMYTGLPAIVGWDWHQRQQRAVLPASLVSNRISDVTSLYNTTDLHLAEEILARYDVQYVFVGQLERTYYLPQGLQKFQQMASQGSLREVYRNDGAVIYENMKRESLS